MSLQNIMGGIGGENRHGEVLLQRPGYRSGSYILKVSTVGWAVSFHVSKEEMFDMLLSDIVLPWPSLSSEEGEIVNKNYADLRERAQ